MNSEVLGRVYPFLWQNRGFLKEGWIMHHQGWGFMYLFRVDNKLYWQLKGMHLCPHNQHLVSASSGPLKCRKAVTEPWSLVSPNRLKITMLSTGETQTFLSVESGDWVPAAVLVSSIWGFSLWKDNAYMWLQLSHTQSAAVIQLN